MRLAARIAVVIATITLAGACAKKRAESDGTGAAGSAGSAAANLERIPEAEVKLATDACGAYVAKACACAKTVPAAEQACSLAKALPDAVRISSEVAASPDSDHGDVLHARDSLRKTVGECIEQTAKLPTLGCP
jgi:hypothetical protein